MKQTTLFVFAIALCSASLRAQEPKITRWSGTSSSAVVPAQEPPASLQKIFSDLGSPTDAYASGGYTLSGPTSADGITQFIGLPFTPTADAHVYLVGAAVQYAGSGANQVNLSLYSDANGIPGTLLARPVTVTNLPTFGTCCTLAEAAFTAGVAVTAGTQYWVVANTPTSGTGSDFEGVWAFVPKSYLVAGDEGSGWTSVIVFVQVPAGAVYGTIP
jgi:hypothetical protein